MTIWVLSNYFYMGAQKYGYWKSGSYITVAAMWVNFDVADGKLPS